MNNTPKTGSQNLGDADLQYLAYDGDGPTIIFLHATGFTPWLWHPIARELAGKYRIFSPYFCDHRESDPHRGGLSWALVARDLFTFCKELKIEKPLMVGHSMGATVITLLEVNWGPLAGRMILIEPIYLPEGLYQTEIKVEQHPLAGRAIKRRNHWDTLGDAEEYLRSKALFKNWDPEMLDLYLKYGMNEKNEGGLELACQPEREASLFMGGMKTNPWPLLPSITPPTLFLEGSESENRAFIDLKKAASLVQKGEYRLISGAGHLIPMEKPKELTAVILEFFG